MKLPLVRGAAPGVAWRPVPAASQEGLLHQAFANAVRGAACTLLVLGSALAPLPSAAVTDGAAIGKCLLSSCQLPLARCVTNPTCAANLLCIQTCTNRPDESTCQIKCGDEFANPIVEAFTKCAVSDKGCVPQRADDGSWPVPASDKLVEKFNTETLQGDWYISAGLNRAFDTFDCQLHKFEAPSPTSLVGNLQWRIKDPVAGTNFVTRYTVQTFQQDPKVPGILYNHDNEFLHYQDDWYILGQRENEYVVVYYRGNNDAWDGYGGAVVYSKAPKLPPQWIPEISRDLQKVNLKWEDFQETDNSCRAAESKLEELEADFVLVETKVAGGLQVVGKEIAKDAVLVEKEIVKDAVAVEKEIVKDVVAAEKEIVKDAVAVEKEIINDVVAAEKEVEKDIFSIFGKR